MVRQENKLSDEMATVLKEQFIAANNYIDQQVEQFLSGLTEDERTRYETLSRPEIVEEMISLNKSNAKISVRKILDKDPDAEAEERKIIDGKRLRENQILVTTAAAGYMCAQCKP
jgi:hypothetical protein